MEIEYLRTSRNSYMIVKNVDYEYENYELQMLLHNEIPSLLDFQVIVGDGTTEYWYDVTGMQSLEKQFSFLTLGEKQLRFFLQNLIYMKNAMEEYLLDDQNLSFSPSMIFYDRFARRIRFCYIPGLAKQPLYDIHGLFEELLQHLDHSDQEAVRLGYDMYERSVQSEFLVEDCIDCLTNSKNGNGVWISEKQQLQSDIGQTEERVERGIREPEKIFLNQEQSLPYGSGELWEEAGAEKNGLFGRRASLTFAPETRREKGGRFWNRKRRQKRGAPIDYSDILDEEQRRFYAAEEIQGSQDTEIFSTENQKTCWKLIYKGDGEEQDFALTDFPFWIGTDAGKVQGVLSARTVSRIHAKVSMEEDKIYLEDYNSTNGTYVNHRMIPMNTPTELQPGDRIFFATEEYAFTAHRF